MEPISAIVLGLALGAKAAAGKALVGEVVKDAYAKAKAMITSRFSTVPLSILEAAPESDKRRAVIAEELTNLHADKDPELVAAAQKLIDLVREQAPQLIEAIGIRISDAEAASIRLARIKSSGTGVVLEHVKATGDIEIQDVEAGLTEIPPKKV